MRGCSEIEAGTSWFSVEPVGEATFAISEYGHWEQAHSYLLVGNACAALVDTGTGIGNIQAVVRELCSLPVRVITTHVHWDHIGRHGGFRDIAVHEADAGWLERGIPVPLEQIRADLVREPFTRPAPAGFDVAHYVPYRGKPTTLLADGSVVDLGGRRLQVLHTPGHSPGHIALFEAETGYLLTGDAAYRGTLYAFYPSTDPIAFADSIERLSRLGGVRLLLPGHHATPLPAEYLQRMNQAFLSLRRSGILMHGSGLHPFDEFAIRL